MSENIANTASNASPVSNAAINVKNERTAFTTTRAKFFLPIEQPESRQEAISCLAVMLVQFILAHLKMNQERADATYDFFVDALEQLAWPQALNSYFAMHGSREEAKACGVELIEAMEGKAALLKLLPANLGMSALLIPMFGGDDEKTELLLARKEWAKFLVGDDQEALKELEQLELDSFGGDDWRMRVYFQAKTESVAGHNVFCDDLRDVEWAAEYLDRFNA